MNPYILEDSLLEAFKQSVNEHEDFLINTYCDYNGKNLWSLICSTMDWLHVSVNGLPYINLSHQNDDVRSLNVLQLIMTFDLVVQAIEQLHRVFEIEHPLKKDHSIFNKYVSDDTFFAQIRACFGAHPVNLDSSDGVKSNVKGGKRSDEKYFASWSSDVVSNADYTVYLYSNKPGTDPIPFSLNFAHIHEYTVKRYSLLADIVRAIEDKKEHFSRVQRQRTIKRSANITEQLQILLEENNIRIHEGDGYHYQINTLIELFTAPQNFPEREREAVIKYLNSLKTLVEEIYESLQSMTYVDDDLIHAYLLSSRSYRFKDVFYDISKVFEYLNNPSYIPSLVDYHLKRLIAAGVLPSFANLETDKLDLQLLLLSKLAVTE